MHEPLLDRIADLERSNRRWKRTSAVLAAALVGVLLSSVSLVAVGFRQTRLQAEQARALAMQARMEAVQAKVRAAAAEAARKQAELQLPADAPKKE